MWRRWPWDQRIIPRVPPPPKHLPANTRFGMADSGTALGIWVRAGICGFGAPASERTVLTLRTSPCAMVGILHREALDLPISKAGKWRNRAHTPSTTPGKELLNEFSSLPSTSVRSVRFPFPVGPFQNFNTFEARMSGSVLHKAGVATVQVCAGAQRPAGRLPFGTLQSQRPKSRAAVGTMPETDPIHFPPSPHFIANTDPWNIL